MLGNFRRCFSLRKSGGSCGLYFLLIVLIALTANANAASVFTDRLDYPPGDTVNITGNAFWANETVTVQVTYNEGETPITSDYDPWDVIANNYGNFDTQWVVPEDALGKTLFVYAEGQTSGLIATTIFTDNNTVMVLETPLDDTLCAGESVEICVTLYQACPGGTYAPLDNRPILFFINEGNCGVDVGQTALATVSTDINGTACATLTMPTIDGLYSIRAKFLGEDKPGVTDPPNSACDPTKRVQLSNSNVCETFNLSSSASSCNNPPTVTCPGDTTILACDLSEICISGFSCDDPNGNLSTCETSLGYLNGDQVCFTPTSAGTYTITLTATDTEGLTASCFSVVTVELNSAPVCSVPSSGTYDVCGDSTFSFPVSATDVDGNLTGCSLVSGVGTLSGGNWTFTTTGEGVYSATFRCEDDCGAYCEETVYITVNYNDPPVITCPADVIVECDQSTDPSATETATATDDNDPSPIIVYSDSETAGSCPQEKIITRTWTATDNCGAQATCVQTITVEDNTAPVITCPADIALECDQSTDPSVTGTATATDNCDTAPSVTYADVQTGNTITRTWTAADACGNSATCSQTITVNDTTDPVITCPADITIECDQSTDPSNTGSATATDNCDGSPAITYSDSETAGSCPQEKTITRTWTATDANGNSASCVQTITVEDNTAPVITCPVDIALECDQSTDPSVTGTATATDNCDTAPTVTYADVQTGNTITRTWTAADACGNSATCVQTITIDDTTDPVITCPADIAIECDQSTDPSNTGSATATDNCDTSPAITYSDSETAGSCPQEKTITRTWTATDANGNSASCVQTITVEDNTAPVITCPADIALECNQSTDPSNTGTATATDNCDTAPSITYADVQTGGTITRTWTATDDCGNSATCVQIITVDDTTDPAITCPADITIECDQSTDPSNTGSATATDNCDGSPAITYTDSETAGSCPQEKTITRTWTATDANGNSASCVQTITVEDNTAPVITCPADLTVECGNSYDPSATGTATASDNCDTAPSVTYADVQNGDVITRTWTATDACGNSVSCAQVITIEDNTQPEFTTCPPDLTVSCDVSLAPGNTGNPEVYDYCDPDPVVTYSDSETPGSCPQEKIVTRTWTVTDAAGNATSCFQTITVVDETAPVITCPDDIMIECDQSLDPSTTGNATATDNCDPATAITYSDTQSGNVITRTWTATDACGNSSSCQQTITVNDTTDPVITCPPDITIECDQSTDPSVTGTATATDNCDDYPSITYQDVVSDGECPPLCPPCPQEMTITRTWTATDVNGNSASCDQIITVVDNTAPVITCPDNITIECDQTPDPSITGTATATDNCDPAPAITYSDTQTGETITRTWTATDACGNSASCTQVISFDDTTAPDITCPADITVNCGDPTDPSATGTATATDNCDASITINYTDTETEGSCPQEKTISRTWRAVDDGGNIVTCVQTINVVDNTAPVITCPADIEIECNGSIDPSVTGTATATDNCDTAPSVTYADVQSGETITRTWTATDACGNSASCDQIITLDDTIAPEISCPTDITIECDESTDPSNTGSATATDNCGASIDITYADSETAGSCANEKTITRTWTATDGSGNSASCDQIITVEDNTAPIITCPADIEIECDGSVDPSVTGTATATDNCDSAPSVTYADVQVGDIITRTWTATDACGNSAACDQTITFLPNSPPVVTCPNDTSIFMCGPEEICISGFSCDDPDDNLSSCDGVGGVLDNGTICFTPVEGDNTIGIIAVDACGEVDSCMVNVNVTFNVPPVAGEDAFGGWFNCEPDSITLGLPATDADGTVFTWSKVVGDGIVTPDGNWSFYANMTRTFSVTAVVTDSCGLTDTAHYTYDVGINEAPVVECPNYTYLEFTQFPAEVCVDGFSATDNDAAGIVSTSVDFGTLTGNTVCFSADHEGSYFITYMAEDECGAITTCEAEVFIRRISICPIVRIEKTHNTLQGNYEYVSIFIDNAQYQIGGFDLLITYDNSALTATGVDPGQMIENCGWEYFTYRFGAFGNCDGACPSGMLRIVALAEINNGNEHPDCFGPMDTGEYELARMEYLVTNDRNFECQYVPIKFFWYECGDNTLSSIDGNILYIDRVIYDFLGNIVWDEENNTDYPESARLANLGAPDDCMNPEEGKPDPVRCVDFRYGGIDIICADSIDDRGDINLNGISNEIADAVILTNYFIYGTSVFTINAEGQTAASDVNADGIPLSVADLVYLVRVITGDASPYNKEAPRIDAEVFVHNGIVYTDAKFGAAVLTLEGNAEVTIGRDAAHMDIISNYDGENTRVLIYSMDKGAEFSGEILETNSNLLSIEAANYQGYQYKFDLIPENFSIRSYPNPFNPTATIEMDLPTAAEWQISIYNVIGQQVGDFNGYSEAGRVTVTWDASRYSSGVYFFKVSAGQFSDTRKMILLK